MSSFLQSVEWESFQKSFGRKTLRIDGNLIIQHDLPFGFNYLYSPHPNIGDQFGAAEKIAREEGSIFLKIDSTEKFRVESLPSTSRAQVEGKFKVCESRSLQPRKTIVLDLQKSENELLRGMHGKTRYNIRLAEKRGVNVYVYSQNLRPDLPEVFLKLLEETVQRDKFYTHERQYYEKLLATGSKNFTNELFFAEYERKIVSTALVNFYRPSSTATYLHGASSREHREVMAPHLLHWRIIQEAKKRGFKKYDLWGIDDERWPGLTRFKKGFGGEVVEYPQSIDVVYRPMWYKIYKFARKLR